MQGIKFIIGIYKNGKTEIQSVLVPKIVSAIKAKLWAKSHGFKYGYIDESKNYWRFRQQQPEVFMKLRTISNNPKRKIRKNPSLDYHKGRLVVLQDRFKEGQIAATKEAIAKGKRDKSLGKSDGTTGKAYHQAKLIAYQKKYNKQSVKDKYIEGKIAEHKKSLELSTNPQARAYVGITYQAKPKLFTSEFKPTKTIIGRKFMQVYGPFKSYTEAEQFEDRLRKKHKMNPCRKNPILGKLSNRELKAVEIANNYNAKEIRKSLTHVKAIFKTTTDANLFVTWLDNRGFKWKHYMDKNNKWVVSFKEPTQYSK